MLSSRSRSLHLLVREWRNDAHLHSIGSWARLAPAICVMLILGGVWLGSATLFWVLVPLALIGAFAGRHPIDVFYSEILAPIIGTEPLPRCGAPRRFACMLAAVWLMATAMAFQNGPTLLGGVLAGLMAAMMFLTATLDHCLPCYAFVRLIGKRAPIVRIPTADEPTVLLEP